MSFSEETIAPSSIKRLHLIWLAASLTLLITLRFTWLAEQGFVEFDEGWLVDSATSMAQHLRGARRDFYVDFKASPITSLIIAISLAIFGDSPQAIMYPCAIMGVLGVLLVSYLAVLLYGRSAGLITLTLGALSPMQTLFSRTVSLDTPGFFFLACSYAVIMRLAPGSTFSQSLVTRLLASGVLLSLSLASNYRVLSSLFLPTLLLALREGFRLKTAAKISTHLAGFLIGIASLDALMRIFYPVSRGYLAIFWTQYKHISSKTFGATTGFLPSFHIHDWLNLVGGLVDIDDPVVVTLAGVWILALPILLWKGRHNRSDLQLCVVLAIPFLLFSLLSVTALRGLTVAQPFIAVAATRLIIALSSTQLLRSSLLPNCLGAILLLTSAASGFAKTIQPDVMGRANPFELAFKETCARHRTGVITILDQGPSFYARRADCPAAIVQMGGGPLDLLATYQRGFRFWLVDAQLSAYKPRLFALWPAFENRQPDLFIPAPSYVRLDHFLQHTVWSGTSSAAEREAYSDWIARWGARLPVFDLNNQIKTISWQPGMKDWYQVGSAYVSTPSHEGVHSGYRVAWDPGKVGSGAKARFNIHFNILPVEGGIGLCKAGSSTLHCNGFAMLTAVHTTYAQFKLVELSASGVTELDSVLLPPQRIDLTTPVWMDCSGATLRAGFSDTIIFERPLAAACSEASPALITRERIKLEAFELSSTTAGDAGTTARLIKR